MCWTCFSTRLFFALPLHPAHSENLGCFIKVLLPWRKRTQKVKAGNLFLFLLEIPLHSWIQAVRPSLRGFSFRPTLLSAQTRKSFRGRSRFVGIVKEVRHLRSSPQPCKGSRLYTGNRLKKRMCWLVSAPVYSLQHSQLKNPITSKDFLNIVMP